MTDSPVAAGPPASPDLPPIAAHAEDLEAIKRTVEDAAAVSGGLWLSYLLALFYLAIATGAVSHADLFLENPVKLPFFGIELPLKAFFFLAPILFVVIHVYTLTYFVILSNKARWFHDELHRQIAEEDDPTSEVSIRARAVRGRLQRQLPANIFIQFLAGPDEIRRTAFGLLLKTVAWTTLVIVPVLLLLLMQIQFLPYHSRTIIWTIRLALLVDLAIVWWLWHIILLGQGEFGQVRRAFARLGTIVGTLASLAVIAFSWTLATFPGEPIEAALGRWRPLHDIDFTGKKIDVSIHDALFHRHIDPTTRRRGIFLSDTLVLPVFSIFEALKVERPTRVDMFRFVFHARGRDLRGAVFDASNLSNIDFEGALLEDASLFRARLQDASLFCAHLQRASLGSAELQNAVVYAANLRGALLRGALGQGAQFDGAHLEGATLDGGGFEGASFRGAYMEAAGLINAHLEMTSFGRAELSAECIHDETYHAQLHHGADLEAANLTGAHLDGASLEDAQLQGALLKAAHLDGVDLSNAFLWRADLAGLLATPSRPLRLKMINPVWASREGDTTSKPWSQADYERLTRSLGAIVPTDAPAPDIVRVRLRALDCTATGRIRCNPQGASDKPPPGRETLEKSVGDGPAYGAALRGIANDLVCSGDWNADHILRGLLANKRLEAAALYGTTSLTAIQQPDCLVSKMLSEDDKNKLISLTRELAARGVPN